MTERMNGKIKKKIISRHLAKRTITLDVRKHYALTLLRIE